MQKQTKKNHPFFVSLTPWQHLLRGLRALLSRVSGAAFIKHYDIEWSGRSISHLLTALIWKGSTSDVWVWEPGGRRFSVGRGWTVQRCHLEMLPICWGEMNNTCMHDNLGVPRHLMQLIFLTGIKDSASLFLSALLLICLLPNSKKLQPFFKRCTCSLMLSYDDNQSSLANQSAAEDLNLFFFP